MIKMNWNSLKYTCLFAVVFAVPVVSILRNALTLSPEHSQIRTDLNSYGYNEIQAPQWAGPVVHAYVTIDGFDEPHTSFRARIRLDFPDTLVSELQDAGSYSHVVDAGPDHGATIQEKFAKKSMLLQVGTLLVPGSNYSRSRVPFQLGQLEHDGNVWKTPEVEFKLPVLRRTECYPFDWYMASAGVILEPDTGLFVFGLGAVPTAVSATVSRELDDYHVTGEDRGAEFSIIVKRDTWYRIHIMWVLGIVTAGLIAVVFFARRKTLDMDTVLAAAATAFAMLSARPVLVPAEIRGLTLVDSWFGLCLGVLIVGLLIPTKRGP